jgi:hypothetical protein
VLVCGGGRLLLSLLLPAPASERDTSRLREKNILFVLVSGARAPPRAHASRCQRRARLPSQAA